MLLIRIDSVVELNINSKMVQPLLFSYLGRRGWGGGQEGPCPLKFFEIIGSLEILMFCRKILVLLLMHHCDVRHVLPTCLSCPIISFVSIRIFFKL